MSSILGASEGIAPMASDVSVFGTRAVPPVPFEANNSFHKILSFRTLSPFGYYHLKNNSTVPDKEICDCYYAKIRMSLCSAHKTVGKANIPKNSDNMARASDDLVNIFIQVQASTM